ncbi:tRNA (N6-isopentenyl adenosine(37)-C2)-methylthiotransferase MiaB [Candidatus Dependentiae bacterium]
MINFFIKTYGCQANVADSQAISNYLKNIGCKLVESEADADLILVNTCAIRQKAEQKVFSYLGELAEFKKQKKYLQVGVIGCIASYRGEELLSRFDHVRFFFGAKENLTELPSILSDVVVKLEKIKKTEKSFLNFNSLSEKLENVFLGGFKNCQNEVKQSFVNIMTGCNNYCSYCIVPFTRGREKSYFLSDILDRVKRDVELGAKEITLLGQNVNSYKDPRTGATFEKLLESVAQIAGDFWVKFVSPHPKNMTKDVLYVMAQYPKKLCDWIHHPLQSGSNKILQAMNRTYTVEKYIEQINWIREILPNATISTDIIVGFPGETEKDYQETRRVIEDVRFDNIYSFIYSPRKYTKAAQLQDNCSAQLKLDRLKALQHRQIEICREQNNRHVGKILECLVEKRLTNDKLLARSQGNLRILFDGSYNCVGKIVEIKIVDAGSVNMSGSLI